VSTTSHEVPDSSAADSTPGDGEATVHGRPVSEVSARLLDDQVHRTELRNRYMGLLQELRVVLPGVQVLVAFLLTVPFSSRFDDLDDLGIALYLAALLAGVGATIVFIAPTAYHRTAGRTARSARLVWAVRTTRVGFALLAVSLLSAVLCVTRFVTDGVAALVVTGLAAGLLVGTWLVLPLVTTRTGRGSPR
jgi:hypothetical protein